MQLYIAGINAITAKTLEPLETMDILIAPENIRKNLKSENDIYKFEYCSLDEKTYKIASYIPLEWKNGKLEKVLLASMDVTCLLYTSKQFQLEKEDAYVFGDSSNDRTMFRCGAHTIALGKHDEILDPYTEYVTDTESVCYSLNLI